MMPARNITIISAIYPPEPQVSARMSFDLAHYLAGQGNCVTVVCPQPSRPLNADYNRYANPDSPVETREGKILVVRLPSFAAPHSRLVHRMKESISFGHQVVRYLARQTTNPDVMYVNSWPMFSQAMIAQFARERAVPMVLQIMDIYPEALTHKLPALVRPLISFLPKMLDTWTSRSAAVVVTISGNMRRIYTESRQIRAERVVTIPTWQDEKLFDALIERSHAFKKYDVPEDRFTFLYLGNIGPVAGVDLLIRAFHAADLSNAQLVIVGDGSEKNFCVEEARRLNARNIYFLCDHDVGNVPLLQAMADVCLLPLKRNAGNSSIPSKLPAYLFSAKPVLATVDEECDTAAVIKECNCGWVSPPEDAKSLAAMMTSIAALDRNELARLGSNGRSNALAHFSKAQGVKRLADLVASAICR